MNSRWTIRIERKRLRLAVGVYPSEYEPQPVLLSLEASGEARSNPASLAQCIDYEPLCQWLDDVWQRSSHVPLLESRIKEVIDFVFHMDPRVSYVRVGLYKERMGKNASAVGMERESTREEYAHTGQAHAEGDGESSPSPALMDLSLR